jgi:ubiquitin-like 1-activating enzyme E1 B
MAGNIIPAIATSNAIIAGLVVMHALNILSGKKENCQSVYLRTKPNHKGQMIVRERKLIPPNPECRVCADQPQVISLVAKVSVLKLY